MDNVEEQILAYPHLSPGEKEEVEAYVEAHPEWASLLRDVRAFDDLAREVQFEVGTEISERVLATYVVVQYFHPEEVPPRLTEAFARIETRLQDEPALQDRAETMRRRLREAESAVDPVSHFEELTGRSLARNEAQEADTSERSSASSAADRGPERNRHTLMNRLVGHPSVRWAGALAMFLVVVYGGLYAASTFSQSTLDRLAAVEVSDQVIANYADVQTRSAVPSADTQNVDAVYLNALSALQNARSTTLGLFPRYDSATLARAERLLGRVIEETEAGSFLALEARFYLGKVALAQGEVEAARSQFKIVVKREGRKAEEAYQILKTLQEEYPLSSAGDGSGS